MTRQQSAMSAFFLPRPSKTLAVRTACVALATYFFFGYICRPAWIRGSSMEPTYSDGGFVLLWKPGANSGLKPGDIVAAALSGDSIMLLKRVAALEGQIVEFRSGRLYIDGKLEEAPVPDASCSWELPPRTVDANCVYLIGDNRSMPIDAQLFGQTELENIVGRPILHW